MRAHWFQALAWLVASALFVACEQGGGGVTPATPGVSRMAPAPPAARERAEGDELVADPTHLLLRATRGLQLTEAQKATILPLEQQIAASEKDTRTAFEAQRAELAAQVRAGAIDLARAQASNGAAARALGAHFAMENDVLDRLHALLDPAQRWAAVASVRAAAPGRSGRTELQAGSGPGPEPTSTELARRRLDRMSRELGLDPAQLQQASDVLSAQAPPRPQTEGVERRLDAILTLFEYGTFSARSAAPEASLPPEDVTQERADQEVALLAKLVPILRPEQRERLAASIETRGLGEQGE